MKTTKAPSLLFKATLFAKSALIATMTLAASITSAEAITIDFDQDSNGNPLAAGTIVNGTQDESSGINPWEGVEITRVGDKGKGITLFNSSCNPFKIENSTSNKNAYSSYDPLNSGITEGCNQKIGSNIYGDEDLATGGNFNTRARGNIAIVQENNRTQNGKFEAPDDQSNGGAIKFTFDDAVALGNIEFLDFDKTDANKINLIAKGKDKNGNDIILADYTFSRKKGYIIDNIAKRIYTDSSGNYHQLASNFQVDKQNKVNEEVDKLIDRLNEDRGLDGDERLSTLSAVQQTDKDEALTADKFTGNPYVEYFLANQDILPEKELKIDGQVQTDSEGNKIMVTEEFENSVWDFFFPQNLVGVRSLEVNFNGISGAISELTYEKLYSDFLSEPKKRVPEPGSIAALAFIGGGMFLSRRRQSN